MTAHQPNQQNQYNPGWIWALAVIGFLSRFALAFRSDGRIASRPYTEDAFYAFSCARQIALGHGFSVDGVHPTNGVQPLICLLYAPCFWIANDKWLGLRLTFIVAGLTQFVSVILIARLLSQFQTSKTTSGRVWQLSPFIGALLWVVIAPLFIQNMNGLETGLVAMLILAALNYYFKFFRGSTSNVSHAVIFGVLLGLLVLARIDCVLFIAAFALYELWRTKGKSFKAILTFVLVAIVVSAPWWIYNYTTFGSFMPISGQSESLGHPIMQNLLQAISAMFDILTIFLYHPFYALPVWLTVIVFIVMVLFWILVFRHLVRLDLQPLMPLVLFCIALFIYYIFFFSAPHFVGRYLHPARILMVIIFALAVPQILKATVHSTVRAITVYGFLIVGLAFSVERYVHCFTAPTTNDFYRLGLWAETHSGQVGVEQSGPANFVSTKVVNLDGKVNPDALAARKASRIGAYIAKERFEYLADWQPIVVPLVNAAAQYGAIYREVDSVGYVKIYQLSSP